MQALPLIGCGTRASRAGVNVTSRHQQGAVKLHVATAAQSFG